MKISCFLVFIVISKAASSCYEFNSFELKCSNARFYRPYPKIKILYLEDTMFARKDMTYFPRLKLIETKDFLVDICVEVGDIVEVEGCNDISFEDLDIPKPEDESIIVETVCVIVSVLSIFAAGAIVITFKRRITAAAERIELDRVSIVNEQSTELSIIRESTPNEFRQLHDEEIERYLSPIRHYEQIQTCVSEDSTAPIELVAYANMPKLDVPIYGNINQACSGSNLRSLGTDLESTIRPSDTVHATPNEQIYENINETSSDAHSSTETLTEGFEPTIPYNDPLGVSTSSITVPKTLQNNADLVVRPKQPDHAMTTDEESGIYSIRRSERIKRQTLRFDH